MSHVCRFLLFLWFGRLREHSTNRYMIWKLKSFLCCIEPWRTVAENYTVAGYSNTFLTTYIYRHVLYKTVTVFKCIVSFFEDGNVNVNVCIVVTVYCGKYEELDKFYFWIRHPEDVHIYLFTKTVFKSFDWKVTLGTYILQFDCLKSQTRSLVS